MTLAVFISARVMQQFLHLEKVENHAEQLHSPVVSLVVQSLIQAAENLAALLRHLPAEAFPAAADVITLANQLNVITVRMENHPAFFCAFCAG